LKVEEERRRETERAESVELTGPADWSEKTTMYYIIE
jgi:hypothetical protein